MEVIVGTAGHIDHGKTALVEALTGTDADRLPEEKLRGITVDLGFAEMTSGDVHLGFVDVPGHERFVKNMLAGASGIDLVMLVIEAGEGVMPQTREHFDICRLLGVKAGVIVLTKTDLVDNETLELARLDAAELVAGSFLENSPVIAVSARTGRGMDELREAIAAVSRQLPPRTNECVVRLAIDRSFSMKGFGAVVTGTLASGEIQEGDELEIMPAGAKVRARGVQTHGKTVATASAGQRVAVNLSGIDHSKIERGMLLSEPGVLRPTQIIDAEIEVLPSASKPLRSRQRVRVHLGTVEALARVHVLNETGAIAPGSSDLVQLRLETAVAAVPSDRFIIRSYSPQMTIAGGQIIYGAAVKHRQKDLAAVRQHLYGLMLSQDDHLLNVRLHIDAAGLQGLSFSDLQAQTGLKKQILTAAINDSVALGNVVDAGGRFVAATSVIELSKTVETVLDKFHRREPLARGMSREALRSRLPSHLPPAIFQHLVSSLSSAGRIMADRETIRLDSYKTKLAPDEAALSEKIFAGYRDAGLEVPKLEETLADAIAGTKFTTQDARKFFQLFLDSGDIIKVSGDFYFAKVALADLIELVRKFADQTNDRQIDMAQFKELGGISRKYAIPLLEYFDREHITSRTGDKRLIL